MTIFSKSGKAYHVNSFDVAPAKERRSVPTVCYHCGETMYQTGTDDLRLYEVHVYSCRNNHERTIYITKEV